MPATFTHEWLIGVARNAAGLLDPDGDAVVVAVELSDVVDEGPGPDRRLRRWQVRVGDGEVAVSAGGDRDADVTLRTDTATARAVAEGRLSAPRAFLDGAIHLDGDLEVLIRRSSRPERRPT